MKIRQNDFLKKSPAEYDMSLLRSLGSGGQYFFATKMSLLRSLGGLADNIFSTNISLLRSFSRSRRFDILCSGQYFFATKMSLLRSFSRSHASPSFVAARCRRVSCTKFNYATLLSACQRFQYTANMLQNIRTDSSESIDDNRLRQRVNLICPDFSRTVQSLLFSKSDELIVKL